MSPRKSPHKPWVPKIGRDARLHSFAPAAGDQPSTETTKLRDPEGDTTPLQGTKDLSDADSLDDVIADAHRDDPPAGEEAPANPVATKP